MFSSCGDLMEKLVVYLAMASLCGVGVSAPLAFTSDEAARGVGFSAFASSVFLGISFILYGWHEPILNHPANLWNYSTGYGLCIMLTAIPYLVAGAVGSPTVRRALFWVAIGTVQSRLVWYPVVFRQVHKLCRRDPTLPSVNVESLAEKAQLLTLIVLGERSVAGVGLEKKKRVLNLSSEGGAGTSHCVVLLSRALHGQDSAHLVDGFLLTGMRRVRCWLLFSPPVRLFFVLERGHSMLVLLLEGAAVLSDGAGTHEVSATRVGGEDRC